MDETYYLRFPSVLKKALLNRKVVFDAFLICHYEPFFAYRAIDRKKDDGTPINRKDFRSYAELHVDGVFKGRVRKNISFYGCSLFTNLNEMKEKMNCKLPGISDSQKIIAGYVKDSNGPCAVKNENSHVDWWLFEGCDPSSDFEVMS
ncbi:hypothetical protein MsAg5_14170 [Methanosarcinaceae archaeon Ag5]|uniref:Uncharacterized protein n=1 Tax=Methanolapillus africanus TaxID=3028297 RepID=A0AAE4SDL7_9EURY|nr:hypothetical protein [Methanosarcinaceae archaeon Ag5]